MHAKPILRPVRLLGALALCLGLLFSGAGAIRAQEAPEAADIAGVRALITAQMEAFKRDDGAAAFAFAAPGIKRMFATPENFMEMVRRQYAPVYRPRYVEFLEPVAAGDRFLQPLILTGEDGVAVLARYALRRQAGGDWRIIGVTLSPAPGQAPL